jgi:PPP family 3-phenylpropionic acid transporter
MRTLITTPAWRIAGLFFMLFAARGLILPFLNLYLTTLGFTGVEIGLLVSASALIQLLTAPALHHLADRHGQHRKLFVGLVVTNVLATLMLIASPLKGWLAGVVLIRDSADTPSAALLSQLVITWISQRGKQAFGRLRAFGSLGWAATTAVSGAIFAVGGYHLLFVLAALCNLMALPLAFVLPARTVEKGDRPRAAVPRPFGFWLLMAVLFLFYVGMNAVAAFSFIYFRQGLGADNATIGIVSSVAALAEIPAMVLIDRVLRRADLRSLLTVGMGGTALLWFAFALLNGPGLLIPLMMVRGIAFSAFAVGMPLLVGKLSHPANAATNQALAQVTIPGLAVLVTGSISGWIFDHLGARTLLELASVAGLGAALLLVATRRWMAAYAAPPTVTAVEASSLP